MIHASSLNDYLNANIIPRDKRNLNRLKQNRIFRIQKGLAMFRLNESFLQKWKAILNQCSTDLMLLIIEQAVQTASCNQKEISELETKLQMETDSTTYESKINKIKEEVDKLEHNLKEFKLRKYKCDTKDCTNDAVYYFKLMSFTKRVTWGRNTYSNYDSSDGGDSTGTSGDEGTSQRETRERVAKGKAKE